MEQLMAWEMERKVRHKHNLVNFGISFAFCISIVCVMAIITR